MSKIKILLVEDEAAIRQMYKLRLELVGYEVATASNGEEGLRLAQSFQPELILLDLRMPQMSGDKMLEKLRAKKWGADIHVIILTNISRSEAPSNLRFLNVAGYVVKAHHTPQQITDVIGEVLEGSSKKSD